MMGYGTLRRANRKRVKHVCYGCGAQSLSAKANGTCEVCSHRFCLSCMPAATDTRWLCKSCHKAVSAAPATSAEPKCETCGTHDTDARCGCGRTLCFRCVCACGVQTKCSCGAPAECRCCDCQVPACGLHARNTKGTHEDGRWLCSDRECGNPAPELPAVPIEPPPKPSRKRSGFVCDPSEWDGHHCWCAIQDSRCDETWELRCPEGESGMAVATLAPREALAFVPENNAATAWLTTLTRAKRVPLDVHKLEQALLAAHADKRTTPCKHTCKAAEHYVTYRGTLFAACRIRSLLRAMRAMRAPVTHVYDVLGEDNDRSQRVMAFTSGRAPGVVAVLCQISDSAVTPEERAALPSIDAAAA